MRPRAENGATLAVAGFRRIAAHAQKPKRLPQASLIAPVAAHRIVRQPLLKVHPFRLRQHRKLQIVKQRVLINAFHKQAGARKVRVLFLLLAIGEGGGGFQIAMQAVFATEIVQLACNIRVAPEPFVPLARALLRSRISSLSFGTAFTIALRSDQDCITQMESGRKLRYSSSIARPTWRDTLSPSHSGCFHGMGRRRDTAHNRITPPAFSKAKGRTAQTADRAGLAAPSVGIRTSLLFPESGPAGISGGRASHMPGIRLLDSVMPSERSRSKIFRPRLMLCST